MLLFFVRIVLAIFLFYIVNWIGAKSIPMGLGYVQMSVAIKEDTAPLFNYLFKVLAPVVYIILLAAIFQYFGFDSLCHNIYWIVIIYWAFRFLYVTIRGQLPLLNWGVQIVYWVSSISLAYWVNSIIDKVESILPSPQALLEQLWILIILFLYSVLNKIEYSRDAAEERIKRYTYKKVDSFKIRFETIIDDCFSIDLYKAIVYSIMVYEDFNRPKSARVIEQCISFFAKKPHTYGIMQVKSKDYLSDEKSVSLACDKIKHDLKNYICELEKDNYNIDTYTITCYIFRKYNPGDSEYSSRVNQVFDNIVEKYYSPLPEMYSTKELLKDIF